MTRDTAGRLVGVAMILTGAALVVVSDGWVAEFILLGICALLALAAIIARLGR